MFHALNGNTANELWTQAAHLLQNETIATDQPSRIGSTREILHAALTLNEPRQRWISSRVPAMNPAFAIAEVVWILCGRRDSALLNYFNPWLPKFAGEGGTYHGAYGFRLRNFFGFDQLERAWNALSNKPESRQVVLQIWDSPSDFPDDAGSPRDKDIPCNICSLLKVRDGRLEWTQIMRSNDLFRGFPHNVVQFWTLQEVIAGWLGLELGHYNHFSDSLHLYDEDCDVQSHIDYNELPRNSDSLTLCKSESEGAFQALGKHCDLLAHPATTVNDIRNMSYVSALPQAYQNLATVLTADAFRRRGMLEESAATVAQCTNECLKVMFLRWTKRHHK